MKGLQSIKVASIILASLAMNCLEPSVYAEGSRRFFFEKQKQVVWDVPVHNKVIAFTFDDGPGKYTSDILRLLAEYHDHATFFVTGVSIRKFPEVLQAEVRDGHEIGNHTDSHRDVRRLSASQIQDEVDGCTEKIEELAHIHPKLFRTPAGYYDERVVDTVNQLGYRMVLWSWDEDSRDWKAPRAQAIVQRVLKGVHPGDIVIFHDAGGNRLQTVRALEVLIPRLHEMGYRLVTVSELIRLRSNETNAK